MEVTLMNYKKLFLYCKNLCASNLLVHINQAELKEVACSIQAGSAPNWDWYLPKELQIGQIKEVRAADVAYFLFVTTAINFCYWTKDENGFNHWCYQGNPKLKGSSGMAQMMVDFYNAGQFPGVHLNESETLSFYEKALTDLSIPYARQRAEVMATLADVGKFKTFLARSYFIHDGSYTFTTETAAELARLYGHAYGDAFLKKAQLFYGMLAANFNARSWAVDTELTAYADYRIPQVLRHMGVLEYDDALALVVDSETLIDKCGPMEKFIRAATVIACQQLAKEAGVTEADVNAYLFLKTRDQAFMNGIAPFHLCVTIDY
ncbi:MAG: hypothetical protein ACI9TY_001085 [Alphaproteobacteria bacterium]